MACRRIALLNARRSTGISQVQDLVSFNRDFS